MFNFPEFEQVLGITCSNYINPQHFPDYFGIMSKLIKNFIQMA